MDTYGIGIGIGSGSMIFFPPLSSIAVSAAFFNIAFLPASTCVGVKKAAKTTTIMTSVEITLKYFILLVLNLVVDL